MFTRIVSRHRRPKAFTLIELLVVISIIALLIGILLPALGAARKVAQESVCATRVRGYQQGMATFAQDNSGWYPGVNSDGVVISQAEINASGINYASSHGASNGSRQAIMLSRRFITPEYAISPSDAKKRAWDPNSGSGIVVDNVSFAMLPLVSPGGGTGVKIGDKTANPSHYGRGQEWRDTFNTLAPVMADRAISGMKSVASSSEVTGDIFSIHSEYTGNPNWRGHVVYNDNHVEFNTTQTATTKYASGPTSANDNLFQYANEQVTDMQTGSDNLAAHAHDAMFVFVGHNQRFDPLEP